MRRRHSQLTIDSDYLIMGQNQPPPAWWSGCSRRRGWTSTLLCRVMAPRRWTSRWHSGTRMWRDSSARLEPADPPQGWHVDVGAQPIAAPGAGGGGRTSTTKARTEDRSTPLSTARTRGYGAEAPCGRRHQPRVECCTIRQVQSPRHFVTSRPCQLAPSPWLFIQSKCHRAWRAPRGVVVGAGYDCPWGVAALAATGLSYATRYR